MRPPHCRFIFWLICLFGFPFSLAASCLDSVQPEPLDLLFWNQAEQLCGYRNMGELWHSNQVSKSEHTLELPPGPALALKDIDGFMQSNGVFGLLVLHKGQVRLEKYRTPLAAGETWTSFSMAKSITSILLGAAVRDGYLTLNDQVVRFLPELAGGAYQEVTVRQLVTMTTGVAWNEDYRDPHSDVGVLADLTNLSEKDFLSFMRTHPRKAEAGSVFNYSTGEANLTGCLVRRAVGRGLADYLSEKVWQPAGMEHEALWNTNSAGYEVSGCCFSATLRDYGRLGLFMLREGANATALPTGWVAEATTASRPSHKAGRDYGYQWWVREAGAYQASGIFGQLLHIDPSRELVIVMLSAWARPVEEREIYQERAAFIKAVKAGL